MLLAVVIVGVVALAIFSFVKTGSESKAADARTAHTIAVLDLQPGGDAVATGVVDGITITLFQDRSRAFASYPNVFSKAATSDIPIGRSLTVAATIPNAPSELRVGFRQPLIGKTVETGHSEFDRIFATREADPAILDWLTPPRMEALLERPVSWIVDSTYICGVGDPDQSKQTQALLDVVDLVKRLGR